MAGPCRSQHIEAVHVGQTEVEHDQLGGTPGEHVDRPHPEPVVTTANSLAR
ncbi:hypothetical protein ACFQ1S_29135 [Kibdelosporangium lantanae]|uniref:Uncharacterized protein n=1 Tax=Kibdelosporangium lantanae TaxID=1497396 RepID=A0ABW3MJB8_9PSEU